MHPSENPHPAFPRIIPQQARAPSLLLAYALFTLIMIRGLIDHYTYARGFSYLKVNFVIELLIVLLFAKSTHYPRHDQWPFLGIVFTYSILVLLAVLFNSNSPYYFYFYVRNVLLAYLIFLYAYNTPYEEQQLAKINRWIFMLAVFQIVYSGLKIFMTGTDERGIGTISFNAGTLSTIFPIFAIGYCVAFFLIYQHKMSYILLIAGYVFMGWAGEKRAIYLYLPSVLLGLYGLYKICMPLRSRFSGKVLLALLAIAICGLYFGASYDRTLNKEQVVGGKVDLQYMLDYSIEYSTLISEEGTGGRWSTTERAFEVQLDSMSHSLFGFGPNMVARQQDQNFPLYKLGIVYGLTGLTYNCLGVGILATLCYLWLHWMIYRMLYFAIKRESDPYWKALAFGTFGSVIIFVLDFLTYSPTFSFAYIISFIFCFFAGQVLARDRRRVQDWQSQIATPGAPLPGGPT